MTDRGRALVLLSVALVLFAALAAPPALAAATKTPTPAAAAAVDINNATAKELMKLPGVGKTTAAKIVAGRPYASADDLAKAGVSKSTIAKITPLITFGSASQAGSTAGADTGKGSKASRAVTKETVPAASGGLIDLNAASEKELDSLPGVGKATAEKIIAGRPYKSVEDLAAAGVSKATIAKIADLVTVGSASTAKSTKTLDTKGKTQTEAGGAETELIDLNAASEKELDSLPGVGKATAEKIIAGRPYKSVDDLAAAGVPKATIAKIADLVTVGRASARTGTPAAGNAGGAKVQTTEETEESETVEAQTPPVKGMVWVNTSSGIYHYEGDRWYGKTKQGKFMSEGDAIKAGFRAAKTGGPKE